MPQLILLECDGMLLMRDHPADVEDLIARCDAAADAGVRLRRGLRSRNATEGLIALRAGYPTAMPGSVNAFEPPAEDHWPTDTAENVDSSTVRDPVSVCETVVRRMAA
jgi:hypothetical protein